MYMPSSDYNNMYNVQKMYVSKKNKLCQTFIRKWAFCEQYRKLWGKHCDKGQQYDIIGRTFYF